MKVQDGKGLANHTVPESCMRKGRKKQFKQELGAGGKVGVFSVTHYKWTRPDQLFDAQFHESKLRPCALPHDSWLKSQQIRNSLIGLTHRDHAGRS